MEGVDDTTTPSAEHLMAVGQTRERLALRNKRCNMIDA